jgi:hypothetical protein
LTPTPELRRIHLHLPRVRLMSVNEMLRTNEHARAKARDHLCGKLAYELNRTGQRPATPLRYVEIDVVMWTPYPFDVDSKTGALKFLLDSLTKPKSNLELVRQAQRQKRGLFIPLGVIHDDTDGEFGLGGCVRRLTVVQEMAQSHSLTLTIQEVLP